MARALTLARPFLGLTAPNPAVGAVLFKNGLVIGEGTHHGAGHPHAEAAALDDAHSRGHDVRGATLCVTLEPCCHDHPGKRTPPCAARLIREGIAAVYAGVPDPNPLVSGRGLALLAEAGIETHWGPLADEAGALIADFAAWQSGRPFVTLKWAQSLDARLAGGASRWITGDEARLHSHTLRAEHDAVAVGAGTLRADNPHLTVRDGSAARPRRLIFAGSRPLPDAAVFTDEHRALTWVVAPPGPVLEQARRLTEGRVLAWEGDARELGPLLLGAGFYRILVEGGPTLLQSFLSSGLWDRAAVFVAPRLLGAGLAGPSGPEPLELARPRTTTWGADVLVEGWNPREAVCSPA